MEPSKKKMAKYNCNVNGIPLKNEEESIVIEHNKTREISKKNNKNKNDITKKRNSDLAKLKRTMTKKWIDITQQIQKDLVTFLVPQK